MIEVRDSRQEDREKLLACADGAFGQELPKGGFAGLLPKLYGPEARIDGNHLIAEENGEILGLVLAELMEYRVYGKSLKIAGIGTVSVAGHARGRGIMKQMMEETVRRLREDGYAFAFLGGQRQRYAYWGFEGCGTQMCFHWNQANLKHSPRPSEADQIRLVPMKRDYPEGNPAGADCGQNWVEEAWNMWIREPVRVERRREQFYDVLCSWQGKPYACLRQGCFAGYVVLCREDKSETARIMELVLEEDIPAAALLYGLNDSLGITQGNLKPDYGKQKLLRELEDICENETLEVGHRFLILDWRSVLETMLEMKGHCRPLEDGEAVLSITEAWGKRIWLKIRTRQGKAAVTEISDREACVSRNCTVIALTAAQAARWLFRSTQVYYKELEGLPGSWFPLPLYVGEQDCC